MFIKHHFTFPNLLVIFNILLFIETEKRDNDYPLKYRLNNGNYIVVFSKGIYIYDYTFTYKKEVKTFISRVLDDDNDSYQTNIAQFLSEDDGYILCLIKNTLYIIDKYGNFIIDADDIPDNFVSNEKNFYSIIPYGHLENEYYFYIITKTSKYAIEGRKYIYYSNNKSFFLNNTYNDYINNEANEISISCQLMYYSNDKVISCFHGSWSKIYCSTFKINDFTLLRETNLEGAGGQFFKSNIMTPERTLAGICSEQDKNLKCFSYDIINNTFRDINEVTSTGCDCQQIDLMVEYFPEKEEFAFWCASHYGIYLASLSKEGIYSLITNDYILLNESECEQPKRLNLFYSATDQKYKVLTDSDCAQIITINATEAPKLYDFPTDEPPPIICHEKCETCEDWPNFDNNNCLSCKDSKYLDSGNCVDNCTNGYFEDDNIPKCKCSSNITCKFCSSESKKYHLCVSCDTDGGYYPKIDDENNIGTFINCYNNEKIPNGYYLNTTTKYYEKCYETCKNCSGFGDEKDNNCTECIATYEFKTDFENDNNCYKICDKYYYFDENKKYFCVDECPPSYSKILNSRCVDKCSNFYKFEYENKCLSVCPSISIPNENGLCIQNNMETNFVSQEETTEKEDNKESSINFPNIQTNTNNCINECEVVEYFNKICRINSSNPLIMDEMIEKIKKELVKGNLNSLIFNNDKNILFLKDSDYNIKFSILPIDYENENSSFIKLGKCEDKLRQEYNIRDNRSLYLFQMEVYKKGLLIPMIEYEVYDAY